MYVIQYRTQSENERKRVEHLLSTRWSGVERMKGTFLFMDDRDEVEQLVRDIESKLVEGGVNVYAVEEKTIESDQYTSKEVIEYPEPPEMAWMLLSLLLSKKKARLIEETKDGKRNYTLIGRKGKASLDLAIEKTGKKCKRSTR